jgi:DNA-binding MarR family transcriptional regulator/DNA-binding CsgD family transcriptional regulator
MAEIRHSRDLRMARCWTLGHQERRTDWVLEAIGLAPEEERAYEFILTQGAASLDEIEGAHGIGRGNAKRLLSQLEAKGLVSRTVGPDANFIPARPDLAIEVLLANRQEQLQRVRASLDRLLGLYHSAPRKHRKAHELVEIAVGPAFSQRFEQIQRSAKSELMFFIVPPYEIPHPENTIELELLAKGVAYKALYCQDALREPHALADIGRYVAAGEEARVLPSLPLKGVIADRSLALVPVSHGQPALGIGAAFVHSCSLVDALTALFDLLWAQATPLALSSLQESGASVTAPRMPFSAKDAEVLSMMLSGLPDAEIARQLGIGVRTLERRISALMAAASATNRMQLGWRASELGWISLAENGGSVTRGPHVVQGTES